MEKIKGSSHFTPEIFEGPKTLSSFPGGSVVKNLSANAEDTGDMGLIPGLGRSPGGGNGNPLQYSWDTGILDTGIIRRTEEPGGLQFMKSQRVRQD